MRGHSRSRAAYLRQRLLGSYLSSGSDQEVNRPGGICFDFKFHFHGFKYQHRLTGFYLGAFLRRVTNNSPGNGCRQYALPT